MTATAPNLVTGNQRTRNAAGQRAHVLQNAPLPIRLALKHSGLDQEQAKHFRSSLRELRTGETAPIIVLRGAPETGKSLVLESVGAILGALAMPVHAATRSMATMKLIPAELIPVIDEITDADLNVLAEHRPGGLVVALSAYLDHAPVYSSLVERRAAFFVLGPAR